MFTFNKDTNNEVKTVLEAVYKTRERVRIWYGDTKTGLSWNDENDVVGRIGKSTGSSPIPLLINNARSLGGPALLDHCIIRIDLIGSKKTLYKHENFKVDIVLSNVDNRYVLFGNDQGVHFKTPEQAQRYIKFMYGERYSK